MQDSVLLKLKDLAETLGLSQTATSRHGRDKLAVIAGYVVLSLATLIWSLSTPNQRPDNVLGASIVPQLVSTSGERWYLIHNESSDDWTEVQFKLNEHFILQGPDLLPAGESFQAHTRDFLYMLYVPRTPRAGSFEELHTEAAPGPFAKRDMRPTSLEIIADEGIFLREFEAASP